MVDVNTNALSTLALVKEHLKITDTSKDDQLKSMINRSLAIIERYLGKNVKSRTVTEYQDGDGTDELLVKQWPIVSVTSIHDDLDREFTSETLIASTNYIIYNDEGSIRLFDQEYVFQIGKQNIKIIYVAGYAIVPEDIEIASVMHVAWLYNKSGSEGHQNLSLGGFSKSYDPAAIPAEIRLYLEPYRKRPV